MKNLILEFILATYYREMGGACITRGTWELHTEFSLESLKVGDHSEDLNIVQRIVLKWIFRKAKWRVWTGLVLLGKGTCGSPLWKL